MTLVSRTRSHYERFPFVEGGHRRIEHWKRRLRKPLPDQVVSGSLMLDVGCGSGEVARSLADRGAQVVCLDLTEAAVRRARQRGPGISACQGNALALPFRDAIFDHAVSIGVLHHTPDAFRGLKEMVRVSKPGGTVTFMLYSRWTPYHLIYRATAPLRGKVRVERLDQTPGWILRVMRMVVAAQVGQRLEDDQLRRLLADQLWTPQASFNSAREVRAWAAALTLRPLHRQSLLFHGNIFTFRTRPSAPEPTGSSTPESDGA